MEITNVVERLKAMAKREESLSTIHELQSNREEHLRDAEALHRAADILKVMA